MGILCGQTEMINGFYGDQVHDLGGHGGSNQPT